MAQAVSGKYLTIPGLVAAEDMSAKQYYAVKLASTDGQVKGATDTNDYQVGILQNDPASGEAAIVACAGVARGISGDTITIGQLVNTLSTGTLQGTGGGTAGTEYVVGVALEAAASGDIFSVLVNPQKLT